MMRISKEIAAASGLSPEESESVGLLVDEWSRHWPRNRLRDRYYYGHVRVRDIGVSVSPQLARRLDPHVDWAAKCVAFPTFGGGCRRRNAWALRGASCRISACTN